MTNYEKLINVSSPEELRAMLIRMCINSCAANFQTSYGEWLADQCDDEQTARQLVLLRRTGFEIDKKIQMLNDLFDEAVEKFEEGDTE